MRESPTSTETSRRTFPPEFWMPLVALYYQRLGLNLSEEMRKNDKRLRVISFEQ